MTTTENKFHDTSGSSLRFQEENEWSETPTSNAPAARVLPFNSESFVETPTTTTSSVIRKDRGVGNSILTSIMADGGFESEFSATNYDDFLRSALFSAWRGAGSNGAAAFSETASNLKADGFFARAATQPNALTTATALTGDWTAVPTGAVFKFSGTSLGTRLLRVVTKHTKANGDVVGLTLAPVDDQPLPSSATTSESVSVRGTWITDAAPEVETAPLTSFSIEKFFKGQTADEHQSVVYRGMIVSNLEMTLSSEELIALSVDFMGKQTDTFGDPSKTGAARDFPSKAKTSPKAVTGLGIADSNGDILPSRNTPPANASSDVGRISIGGRLDNFASDLTFSVDNNLRAQKAIGSLGPVGVGVGRSNVSGSFDVYFKRLELYRQFQTQADTSLVFAITTALETGEPVAYSFCFPRMRITSSAQPITGVNSEVFDNITFQALPNEAEGGAQIVVSKTD